VSPVCLSECQWKKEAVCAISFLHKKKSQRKARNKSIYTKGCYIDNDNQTVDKKVNISKESDYQNREEVSEKKEKKVFIIIVVVAGTTDK
jgi:hypothetical protein